MIPEDFIQELIERADIVDVIGSYIPLKKRGVNYLSSCPFHQEKTPSFTVSPNNNFYHCFGCEAHGNAIGFIMEYQGIGFVEAVTQLADRLGLVVPNSQSNNDKTKKEKRKKLEAFLLTAMIFYKAKLKQSPQAIQFLKQRGLTGKIARKFEIGFAPDTRQALREAFPDYENNQGLIDSGLVSKAQNDVPYDRFRGRIIYPIRDSGSKLVGFGGRIISDREPKYLNSPETLLFNKGREFYGLPQAINHIRENEKIVIVEGYMDVIALAQFGVGYSVASLGTAISEYQINKLLTRTDHIIFAFDGDTAGRKAAWRALENSLSVISDEKLISFLFFEAGADPDSFIRVQGVDAFHNLLKTSLPLSEYLVRVTAANANLETAEGKAKYLKELKKLLSRIKAPNLSIMIKQNISQVLNISPSNLGFVRHSPHSKKRHYTPAKKAPRIMKTIITILFMRREFGSYIDFSEINRFKDVFSVVGAPHEWMILTKLLDEGASFSSANFGEKQEDDNVDNLIRSAQEESLNKELLSDAELNAELTGAWGKLKMQLRSAMAEQLLSQENLSTQQKQELLRLQSRDL